LRKLGDLLGCNECEDRKQRLGFYCDPCPLTEDVPTLPVQQPAPPKRRDRDDSIVLL
jgi:hypothetical protein